MGSISVPTALLIGGGLSAGGGILSGVMGSNAAGAASKAQQASVQQALGLEQANLAQTGTNLQPYMTAGTNALASIQQMLGLTSGPGGTAGAPNYNAFTSSPGYQFMLNQGNQGIQNSAMAQGGMTGNTAKALQQFGQQSAGTSFQQFLNNLGALSGSGQNAASTLGQIGANVSGNMGGQTIGGGNAAAAGIIGSSNALSGGINSALGSIGQTASSYAGNAQMMAILGPYLASMQNGGGSAGGSGWGAPTTGMGGSLGANMPALNTTQLQYAQ